MNSTNTDQIDRAKELRARKRLLFEQAIARDPTSPVAQLAARLRAANPVPRNYDHLFDPDYPGKLWRLIGGDDIPVLDTSGEDAGPVEVKRTRQRKPTVANVIRQMKRAGVEVAGCEINPRDGTVKVITGKPVQMQADDDRNEWDTVQ